MPSTKPTLPALKTPVTSSFPVSDGIPLSAFSIKTPLSAKSACREAFPSAGLPSAGLPSAGLASAALTPGFPPVAPLSAIKVEEKTPITPPVAYLDFLRSIAVTTPSLASPPLLSGKPAVKRASTSGSTASQSEGESVSTDASAEADNDGETTCVESGPSTGTSDGSDCSCVCDHVHKSPGGANPNSAYPLSAPPCGPAAFTGLHIPRSPAGADSPARSPFSARSIRSPFDWDAAIKARRFTEAPSNPLIAKPVHHHNCGKTGRTSVRHIREVVTRTVTYTPRMNPAPKGKRRKVE